MGEAGFGAVVPAYSGTLFYRGALMSPLVKTILGWAAVVAGVISTTVTALHVPAAADVPGWLGTVIGTVGAALHLF